MPYAVILDPYSYRCIQDGWTLNSGEQLFDVLPPDESMDDAVDVIRSSIQGWMDATAQQNDYDNAASAISYVGDSNTTFSADGIAMRNWRSAVWTAAYALESSMVANPPRPWPTSGQIIAQLPQPETFGWTIHGTPP